MSHNIQTIQIKKNIFYVFSFHFIQKYWVLKPVEVVVHVKLFGSFKFLLCWLCIELTLYGILCVSVTKSINNTTFLCQANKKIQSYVKLPSVVSKINTNFVLMFGCCCFSRQSGLVTYQDTIIREQTNYDEQACHIIQLFQNNICG